MITHKSRSQEGARMPELMFVPCKIERGGFSSERTFTIVRDDGEEIQGTANVEYLRGSDFGPIPDDQPPEGEVISGYVQCRIVQSIGNGRVILSVPSEYVVTSEEQLVTLE